MIKSFDVRFCWFASCNFFPLSHYCMSLPLTFWATQELLINYLRLFSMTQTPPDPKLFFSFQSVICICGSARWQMSVSEITCNVSAGSVVWPPSHGWQGLWLRGQLDHTQPGALHADRPLCPPPQGDQDFPISSTSLTSTVSTVSTTLPGLVISSKWSWSDCSPETVLVPGHSGH